MRVAVLLYASASRERLFSLGSSLSEGLQSQGHSVDVFDLKTDDIRVAMYDYICVGTQGTSLFGGKIAPDLPKRLEQITGLQGKRSFAFVEKKMFSTERLLARLMKAMESQGLYIRNSNILKTPADGRLVGASVEVARKSQGV